MEICLWGVFSPHYDKHLALKVWCIIHYDEQVMIYLYVMFGCSPYDVVLTQYESTLFAFNLTQVAPAPEAFDELNTLVDIADDLEYEVADVFLYIQVVTP